MTSEITRGSRLWVTSTACAILVHVGVVGAAIWVTTSPKAAPSRPEEVRIKIATPETPEPPKEIPPPPEPEPQPAPRPEPEKPQPIPTPEPMPVPLPELASTAEPTTSSRAAPVAEPTPPKRPEPVASESETADYYSTLLGWLDRHKDYPRDARRRREEGVTQLYFRINRQGRVLEYRIEGSAGHAALDEATIRMIERANPLPAIPDNMPDQEIELIVPVEFFLRRGGRR